MSQNAWLSQSSSALKMFNVIEVRSGLWREVDGSQDRLVVFGLHVVLSKL